MKIYIFGNEDLTEDNTAIKAANYLKQEFRTYSSSSDSIGTRSKKKISGVKPRTIKSHLNYQLKHIEFIFIKPNEDLPFIDEDHVILIDTIQGIDDITVLTENDLDKLITNRSTTAHDYDLGFQLKYLKKLGKLNKIMIIGLPMNRDIDYAKLIKILKNQ